MQVRHSRSSVSFRLLLGTRFWSSMLCLGVFLVLPVASQVTTAEYKLFGVSDSVSANTLSSGLTQAGYSVNLVTLSPLTDLAVTVDTCPAGAYSVPDSSTCTKCPAGKYSGSTSASSSDACVACDAGSYSTAEGATSVGTCVSCSPGTYASGSGGSSAGVCLSCPLNSNSFSGSKSISSCVCNAGYSGPNGGTCTACGTGVWCLNGASNNCPLHSNSSALSSTLSQCLCKPGYFGDTSLPTPDSATLCSVCKEDHFCPGGAVNYTSVCPDGKYSLPGSDDVGDCVCPVHSTSQQKSSQSAQCVCESGYYKVYTAGALLGGWQCEVCKPGEFCYDNTNRTCPPHSVSTGVAKSVQDCYCVAGYSNASTQTEQQLCVDCPANSYCLGKGQVSQCVSHAVSPTQSTDATKCFCDWGWKGVNNSACVACASPTFCYSGIEARCSEGTFSEPLSWDRSNCSCIPGRWGPRGGPCIKCTAGKYNLLPGCVACNNQTDTDCIKCEVGTASSLEGRNTTCDACPNGTYSGPAGATNCTRCPNGTYSLGKAGTCTKCPLGWYAPEGSVKCLACPRDTYLNLEGQGDVSACMPCPLGTVSARLGNPDPECSACPPGTYQLNGECTSCPAGSYSRVASVACKPCLPGTYSSGNATACTDCDIGSYSSSNFSSECAMCGAGTYTEYAGMSKCSPCAPGYFVEYDGAGGCSRCSYGQYAGGGASSVSFFVYYFRLTLF